MPFRLPFGLTSREKEGEKEEKRESRRRGGGGMEAQEELYVAVPEKSKEGMSLLLWALRNAPKDVKIVITHVYILDQMIPGPLGGRVHPSIASQIELIAYRQEEKAKVARKLDDYIRQCAKAKFKCEKLVFGSDNDIANGILELIALKGIKKLIMGAAEDRRYSMRMIEPTSNKAISVMKRADTSCTIWFVCKGNLIYTREANQEKTIKPLQLQLPLPCNCSLSPGRTQEQYSYSSSGSSPGTSYKISDSGSLFMTEADAASYADIELKDALADLTLIVQKVGDSICRQKQSTEHEVEYLKAELNEKDKLLQEANRHNLALENRVKELEENIASVNGSMNLLQSESIQPQSEGEANLKHLQETTIQKLVLEEHFKGLGDSLEPVKAHVESLLLENRQLQQEQDRAVENLKH